MAKTNLTDEEKKQIITSLNQDTEPATELMAKLFPGIADEFDVKKLDRAKIASLEYAGKRSEAAILNQTLLTEGGSPLQVERCFIDGTITDKSQLDLFEQSLNEKSDWRNLVIQGDNLQFLKTCYQNTDPLIKDKVKGKVKLIYIDPPFGTGDEYGTRDGEMSYSARLQGAEFLESLRERIVYLRDILSNDGNFFIRIDYHFGHYIKVMLDEIFGKENFQNDIVINRFKRMLKNLNQFNVANDSIYFYSKSGKNFYKEIEKHRTCSFCGNEIDPAWRGMSSPGLRRPPERIIFGEKLLPPRGRHWTFTQNRVDLLIEERRIRINEKLSFVDLEGNKIKGLPEYLQTKNVPIDSNWTDLKGYVFGSRYPTENPEELLERVIECASDRGDLVMDVFAGSGTTAAVAEKLGRRWIVCDFGKHSIYTMQRRFLRIAESKALGKDVKKGQKFEKPPKPFCVISCGAYDFSRIMNLRENKEAYINFVLGLFQLNRDQKNLSGKYKLTNICGEKNGDPVEVYPVWEDEYLRDVRIDENYLRETIIQGGGKLKGNYYIITPETCTVVSDTTMKNSIGDEVYFKLLKFPYKILEDVSRNFQVHDQPNSQNNVNKLINSTGFYFNNDVELELEKTDDGLKITKFTTRILDKEGNYYKGFDGLAMLLIDIDYNGKLFDMEKTVFAKDLGENVEVKVAGLTDCIAVIAIDKHGNESKPFIIKD